MKDEKLIIYYSLYFIFGIFYVLILKEVFKIIDLFYNFNIYLLIFLYLLLGINIIKNSKINYIIIYIFTLFVFLFLRKSKTGFNFEFYLFDWIKLMFKNKTIFINVIGNTVLFIPLGFYLKSKIHYAFSLVIIIELLQVILNKGVFDIVDIVLNYVGIVIGFTGELLWMIKIKKSKNKMKKTMN